MTGSELLAASMRNNDRGILVGERSYGKGTIQKTYGLAETSTLKLTVGHFLPNGRPIPGGGVVPDIEVINLPHATFNGEDAQLDTAIEYLLRKIAEDPRAIPMAPAYPDLAFPYPRDQQQ